MYSTCCFCRCVEKKPISLLDHVCDFGSHGELAFFRLRHSQVTTRPNTLRCRLKYLQVKASDKSSNRHVQFCISQTARSRRSASSNSSTMEECFQLIEKTDDILHSKAIPAPPTECNNVSAQILTFLSSLDPALRLEAFGFGEDFRVRKHDEGGHTDWRL